MPVMFKVFISVGHAQKLSDTSSVKPQSIVLEKDDALKKTLEKIEEASKRDDICRE